MCSMGQLLYLLFHMPIFSVPFLLYLQSFSRDCKFNSELRDASLYDPLTRKFNQIENKRRRGQSSSISKSIHATLPSTNTVISLASVPCKRKHLIPRYISFYMGRFAPEIMVFFHSNIIYLYALVHTVSGGA